MRENLFRRQLKPEQMQSYGSVTALYGVQNGPTRLIYRYQNCALRLAQSLVMYMEIRQENYG